MENIHLPAVQMDQLLLTAARITQNRPIVVQIIQIAKIAGLNTNAFS